MLRTCMHQELLHSARSISGAGFQHVGEWNDQLITACHTIFIIRFATAYGVWSTPHVFANVFDCLASIILFISKMPTLCRVSCLEEATKLRSPRGTGSVCTDVVGKASTRPVLYHMETGVHDRDCFLSTKVFSLSCPVGVMCWKCSTADLDSE